MFGFHRDLHDFIKLILLPPVVFIIALNVNLFKIPKKVKEILEASLRQDDDF